MNGPTPNLINKAASMTSGTVTGDIYQDLLSNITSNEVSYLSFEGSFTSPPCYEKVSWYVLTKSISVSSNNISALVNKLTRLNSSDNAYQYNNLYANVRSIQSRSSNPYITKGTFWWTNDYNNYIATPQSDLGSWAAVWAASISPFIFILIGVIIYGLWALSQNERK